MADTPDRNSQCSSPGCCSLVQISTNTGRLLTPKGRSIPNEPWIIGSVETPVGRIPQVDTALRWSDTIGSWKARWDVGRMKYRVEPRLYAVGSPTKASPVFVTANYKMSFDRLRSNLTGVDGWILVLDTKGINVWCAAGKGTFGTLELVHRAEIEGMKQVVSHRRLILPQLGATGVSAHEVREASGFHVFYGPVRVQDLPAYMQGGLKATPDMRRVTFTFKERVVLVPADVIGNLRYAVFVAACFLLLSGLGTDIYSLDRVARFGIINGAFVLLAALSGAILPALLLPWLPGRAFSVKGAFAAVIPILGVLLIWWGDAAVFHNWFDFVSWLLIFSAVTSFIGMNFTGSSTYTSLSGVKKEMRIALPVQICAASCGIILWLVGLFV